MVRECHACLFMATTSASHAAVILMIAARVRCAKHSPVNVKTILVGCLIAVVVWAAAAVALVGDSPAINPFLLMK